MSWVTVGVTVGSALFGNTQAKNAAEDADERAGGAGQYATDRRRQIDQTRALVDRSFDSPARQKQYQDYSASLRDYMGGELIRKKRDSARNLKFALARAGQTGGSVAADSSARLGDEYTRASLQGEREVQGAETELRAQDERSRQALLGLAESGMAITDATQRSNTAQASNLGNARLDNLNRGLGDVFTDTAATYKAINERAAQRKGFGYKANRADLYGP